VFIGDILRPGCPFYLYAEPPADSTHNVPLSSQSKSFDVEARKWSEEREKDDRQFTSK